jgi:hypothetical protein
MKNWEQMYGIFGAKHFVNLEELLLFHLGLDIWLQTLGQNYICDGVVVLLQTTNGRLPCPCCGCKHDVLTIQRIGVKQKRKGYGRRFMEALVVIANRNGFAVRLQSCLNEGIKFAKALGMQTADASPWCHDYWACGSLPRAEAKVSVDLPVDEQMSSSNMKATPSAQVRTRSQTVKQSSKRPMETKATEPDVTTQKKKKPKTRPSYKTPPETSSLGPALV